MLVNAIRVCILKSRALEGDRRGAVATKRRPFVTRADNNKKPSWTDSAVKLALYFHPSPTPIWTSWPSSERALTGVSRADCQCRVSTFCF